MSAVTSQLKEMKAVLSSQEASIGSLKSSEARLSCQVTEQRDYIEELQAKLMAALREVGRRPMRELTGIVTGASEMYFALNSRMC